MTTRAPSPLPVSSSSSSRSSSKDSLRSRLNDDDDQSPAAPNVLSSVHSSLKSAGGRLRGNEESSTLYEDERVKLTDSILTLKGITTIPLKNIEHIIWSEKERLRSKESSKKKKKSWLSRTKKELSSEEDEGEEKDDEDTDERSSFLDGNDKKTTGKDENENGTAVTKKKTKKKSRKELNRGKRFVVVASDSSLTARARNGGGDISSAAAVTFGPAPTTNSTGHGFSVQDDPATFYNLLTVFHKLATTNANNSSTSTTPKNVTTTGQKVGGMIKRMSHGSKENLLALAQSATNAVDAATSAVAGKLKIGGSS